MNPKERLSSIEQDLKDTYLFASDIEWLIGRIKRIEAALEFYKDMDKLEYPSDWKCSKMGGPPSIENYETKDIGAVAREALEDE